MQTGTVYVVDDDELVRNGIANLCRSVGHDARTFSSTDEYAAAVKPETPSCLVLDVRFPGIAATGLEFQRRIAEDGHGIPVIMITGHGDVRMCADAMKSGAVEFLLKPVREQDLLDAVKSALARDHERRTRTAEIDGLRRKVSMLTPREIEVMALMAKGFVGKQIAAELAISEVTVKVHRARVMQKLDVTSPVLVARIADRLQAAGEPLAAGPAHAASRDDRHQEPLPSP